MDDRTDQTARPTLHLHGTVVLGDDHEVGDAWVVDGRLTLERPHGGRDETVRLDGVALPGLVDVHCHVGLGPHGAVGRDEAEAQAVADRDSGVLLVRDAGSPADTRWVDERDDLPRLLRAGHHLARPKRYLRGYGRELDDVVDLPAAVAQEADRGDGWVKLVADWIDREVGDLTPLWPADLLAEAVAVAHGRGARVTAHTFSTEAVDDLLAAGVDCLEHGTGLTDDQVAEVVRRGVAVTPTLLQVARFEEIAAQGDARFPVYAARMRRMHSRRYEHVAALHEAGVRLLVGTDAGGTLGHGLVAQECAEMVRAGVPARDVVAAASWRTRTYLGVPEVLAAPSADLVVYPADPRTDVGVLAAPAAVVLRGALVAPGTRAAG
ncbi:amidohydrolase, imidazolonepropionase [Sanguibacter keddieii DSM 10542]|uniref:Amidohydrolase, imidazolonepropionase n=1 Tax=Sanguibacter keddieii (strain ATCC 51767 / DSM 10542 / NCFB 3025 / ST-74) TaxID=446469 RepID=D1BJ96_SANKS|nr:amidohydrolase family protein [Sanguibacter keddieii]ACZ22290.1 amidohydrolase, imidazolonepropionase [Sanguibacter keddieii DSM 10542]